MSDCVLSQKVNRLEESATLALNAKVKQLAAAGKTIYNLTAGEPDCATPDYIIEGVIPTLDQNKYTPVAGLKNLRDEIATHCQAFYKAGWITTNNVVVTAGAKPALFGLLQAILDPEDEVIMPTPAWVSYQHMVELAQGVVVPVALTADYDLDVSAIEKALTPRTKAIIINSPNNPTGTIFSAAALQELAQVVQGRALYIIADDLYTKLVYEPYTPITTYGFNPEQLLIVNGFSKSQALTGWRIGYVITPEPVAVALTKILSHTSGNAALPSQHAGLVALVHEDKPPMLDELKVRRELVAQALDEITELSYVTPGGAFYFFIDIRKITDNSVQWCQDLLETTGVALVPGDAFFAPGHVRLSFATDQTTLISALKNVKRFVAKGK